MKYFLCSIAIVILLLIFLPSFLSLSSVNQFLLKHLNSYIPGKIKAKQISLTWRNGISLKDVQLDDPKGNTVAKLESVDLKAPLYSFLLQSIDLSSVKTHGSIELISDEDKSQFSIESLLGASPGILAKNTFDQIISLLGTTIEGKFTIDQGECSAVITSQNLTTNASFLLKDGTLILSKPLTGTYRTATGPINFWIDQKGFLVPLEPFSLETIQIESIKIEPGKQKMQSRSGGLISLITTLLRIKLTENNEVSLWFTPVYANISKGQVSVKRCDVLFADKYPLATWGTIDLVKDQVLMTLGISAEALKQAFLILSWKDNYFVQIPVRGPIEDPEFNMARATAKITAMRLQQTWSPQTAILGTLMGIASDIGADDPPAPPPTTVPFPWQK